MKSEPLANPTNLLPVPNPFNFIQKDFGVLPRCFVGSKPLILKDVYLQLFQRFTKVVYHAPQQLCSSFAMRFNDRVGGGQVLLGAFENTVNR